ncbi:heavy metal translocating P-type ATPase [Oscillospiraceae bacterium Marseille-Q3528]|nr:heavy metal translocating P-type ATPase [Oscillospiraceae bacterium Marseille-Q3528]
MRFQIKHEMRGRLRIHVIKSRMTCEEADMLQYYLTQIEGVEQAKVYERTGDASVVYTTDRQVLLEKLQQFRFDSSLVPKEYLAHSGRELNSAYQEKLVMKVVLRYAGKLFVPYSIRAVWTAIKSVKYLKHGVQTLAKGRLEVPVLDATAIGVSVFRGDMKTAGSIMFLLGIGEILEEWTHKKSVSDLARSMSLRVGKVWLKTEGQEVLVDSSKVQAGDSVIVHMGNVIPFDGIVEAGEAMVNQASMTGESLPVHKVLDSYVYAGTVVEEGEITIRVKQTSGSTRYEKIVSMIEESEKLKSGLESKAEHLADRLVPYTLLGTGLVYLLTRNATRALSVLMVDFSCALKLAMPISVLSAIREAGSHHMTVKGGKFLEAVAAADTIVFDKTGTLTKARPTVKEVVPFNGRKEADMLRVAACLEEHFPHSMAKAVVKAAQDQNLEHEEMHSKVEYIVAHGIASTIQEKRVVIGSYHFVFEDENCVIPAGEQEKFDSLSPEISHLYLAIEGVLSAVIGIEDPLREEAPAVLAALKAAGITKTVMMTGDSERTAAAVAAKIGVDEYHAEVLPEDKANFIEAEKAAGRTVIMIGDGINDSPALSAADVGIAVSDGAEIAREIADITITADDLQELVTLKELSAGLMKRIHGNYRKIVGINTTLIVLGAMGILTPSTSALLHNMSTLGISLKSMENLLPETL